MKTQNQKDWLSSQRVSALLDAERASVKHQLSRLFGRNLLQIGSWSPALMQPADVWRSGVLGPEGPVDVRCELSRLPLAGRCVDAVLLAHSLESADSAHQLLREVDRVLSPRGQLLILGFNPWGLWGLRQRFLRSFPALPQGMRPLASHRLQDWLRLLDYEVQDVQRISSLQFDGRLKRFARLAALLGWFAPVYLIRARKRRIPITPASRPIWSKSAARMDTVGMPTRSAVSRVVVPLNRGDSQA